MGSSKSAGLGSKGRTQSSPVLFPIPPHHKPPTDSGLQSRSLQSREIRRLQRNYVNLCHETQRRLVTTLGKIQTSKTKKLCGRLGVLWELSPHSPFLTKTDWAPSANVSGTFERTKVMELGCGEGAAVRAQLSPRSRRWRSCEGSLVMGGVRGAARTPRLFCPRPAGGYVALGRGPSRAEATGPEGAA